MTAPRSNFTVPTSSGWLVFNGPTGYQTAHMNGSTLVSALEHTLRTAPQLANPVRTFDGSTVRGTDVAEGDRKWGPTVYRALWAVSSALGAPSTTLQAIQLAAQAHVVNLATATIAARVILMSMGYMSPAPRLPANSLLPGYMAAMPGINTIVNVTDSTPDEMTAVGVTSTSSPVTPPPPAATDPVTGLPVPPPAPGDTGTPGKTDSGAGPDTGTPDHGGKDGGPLPTGQPDTAITSHGISAGPIVAVGVGIAVLGLIAYSLSQPSAEAMPRHNPPMHGPKQVRAYLRRVHLVGRAGGHSPAYLPNGQYMGHGAPVWEFSAEDVVDRYGRLHPYVQDHVRAANRAAAEQQVREQFPGVRFTGRG